MTSDIFFSKVTACALVFLGECTFGCACAAAGTPITGDELAHKVYFASHNESLRNAVSKRTDDTVAMVVNRVPIAMRDGRKPHIQTFDTYINNQPADQTVDSMQMAILTSGKAKGTGILVTRFLDAERGATLAMWLPALRKMRQINEPSHEDVWFGTNLTYGELVLRKPEDETHELIGEATFEDCLPAMVFQEWERNRYTELLPGEQCGHRGTPVYLLKSTTKFVNWWYDYHVTEIDRQTYWPYRTVYFKNGEKVKTVVVDWQSLEQPDPALGYPRFIYALSHDDGRDSLVFVPRATISLNTDTADDYWSVDTLRDYLKNQGD
ncbi:MAG: outer membrane lipoprotein-sorting protein [Gammaproteobacteria bacterium]|nr:outer membrane lipoprotein-sorting protein [Gammaproteobacteria bacterium]